MSLSGHQSASAKSVDYLTPPDILDRLGTFDLDPCCPSTMPWCTAPTMLTQKDDGLECEWFGRVWMNPPFGAAAARWLHKLRAHGDGIALVPARTETRMFFDSVWSKASGVLFVRGRPHFHFVDGTRAPFNSGAPICLIAYGNANLLTLERSGLGRVVSA